jgi:hypothetical protein
VPSTKRLIVVGLSVALAGGWASTADAAFVGKSEARAFLLRALPPGAPRALLRDERSAFFRTAQVWVEPAPRCRRRAAASVACRFRVRLVPDAAHRKHNWWPISCRGAVLVRRLDDGRLKGSPRAYVCRTMRP